MLQEILNTLTVKNIGRHDVIRAQTVRNIGCDIVLTLKIYGGFRGTNRIRVTSDAVGSPEMSPNFY
jgi:hypothetical protein